MILPAQTIRAIQPPIVAPFVERQVLNGMSYGLSIAGYDVRVAEFLVLPPGAFVLASTIESFNMPIDVMGEVADKSTWARRGIACQNTRIEPGWKGHLTLEISNHHGVDTIVIEKGMPIAQIVFHRLEAPAERGYEGKYQHQEAGPQAARSE